MNMCNAGKSTPRAFDLLLRCVNSYSSASSDDIKGLAAVTFCIIDTNLTHNSTFALAEVTVS